LSKTLFDGLNAIDQTHQDLPPEDKNAPASQEKREAVATIERVRSEASLLFEPSVVEQIAGLLEGTTVYTTNTNPGLKINIPLDQTTLAKKLKYTDVPKDNPPNPNPPSPTLQITGILTDTEKTQALAL